MKKIAHLTSAHPRYDTRIFVKECSSLAEKEGYTVHLIVADGKEDEIRNNVHILDVGAPKGGRLSRFTRTVHAVFDKASAIDADLYHLHDPELIPIGLKLKKRGKKVIFDAHEDLPKQILSKSYLNKSAKIVLSKAFGIYERYACRRFDAIVTATPYIREKFLRINPKTIDINNFPILGELANETPWDLKKDEICYIGGIAKIRGILEIVRAMNLSEGLRLKLAGSFESDQTRTEVLNTPGWVKVDELGFLGREGIADLLHRSKAGLVTLHPTINYMDALPVKMFEYMAAGIPVIASDFPLWRSIVDSAECGILVDPLNPSEIAEAINYVMKHPKESQKMGLNGKKAVLKTYNWEREKQKLSALYSQLLEEGK
ncbi:MAG: glycosyl transferase [Sulfuricurvum sp. RIFCSPLOWO2_02_FULL_43_45]|nr:MAG: glycosyl transferase [Sulfuricurvum sp. RIFCSPLOWO2_02_FULL_43_45]